MQDTLEEISGGGGLKRSVSAADAAALDAMDPMRHFRERFSLPEGVAYLDGNSLGALPLETSRRLAQVINEEWGWDLIRSWKIHDWLSAPWHVGDKIARLIGANAGEVVVADSTTVNLCKLIYAALAARPGRSVVLSEPGNFPTDLYAIQGVIRSLGNTHSLRLAAPDRLIGSIARDTALVVLTHVHYKSSAVHDMHAITQAAHAQGALVLWDLSHSAGAVKVDLNSSGADFAVGCGYKYLNGGPGAPAFLYVANELQTRVESALAGWMGHANPFDFQDDFVAAPDIRRFLCGTSAVLGVAALEVGVDLLLEAGMDSVVAKARAVSDLFIALVEDRCAGHGLRLIVPRASTERGSHVAFSHPNAYPIMQALIESGVIGDVRGADVLRFGITPLYTRYDDVWIAAERLHDILESGRWQESCYSKRGTVT